MKAKYILLLIVFFTISNSYSQSSLNDYKYVIVPQGYRFFKENNKYQLNDLTKFLFNKYNFTSFIENETFPKDLALDRCLALRADVLKESSVLKTKLKVELRNCNGIVVFTTEIGKTGEKDFKKGYNLALRDAFKSFENVNYKYVPNNERITDKFTTVKANAEAEEIKRLEEEVKALKEEKKRQAVTFENQKVKESKVSEVIKKEESIPAVSSKPEEVIDNTVLYAQKITNGFQLVDSTPKVVMILLETPRKDTFIVKDVNATVYKEDGFWYISKNENNTVTTKKINIKF
ncbi:hypothetical protein D7030_13735 [Flavobacteriaceae bacterium AU392]|nr:hypothetical protein D1817_04755 [Flavobacteriaceae bacterium]RKM81363.1 hypothetical protein D7030_13735 [Flavobacteriaceae bacterium AU392]